MSREPKCSNRDKTLGRYCRFLNSGCRTLHLRPAGHATPRRDATRHGVGTVRRETGTRRGATHAGRGPSEVEVPVEPAHDIQAGHPRSHACTPVRPREGVDLEHWGARPKPIHIFEG